MLTFVDDWFLLRVITLRVFWTLVCTSSPFLFIDSNILLHKCATTYSSLQIAGYLGCFQHLLITKLLWRFMCKTYGFIFSWAIPRNGINCWVKYKCMFKCIRNYQTFPKWISHLHSTLAVCTSRSTSPTWCCQSFILAILGV